MTFLGYVEYFTIGYGYILLTLISVFLTLSTDWLCDRYDPLPEDSEDQIDFKRGIKYIFFMSFVPFLNVIISVLLLGGILGGFHVKPK